jgi:hypothetical protein
VAADPDGDGGGGVFRGSAAGVDAVGDVAAEPPAELDLLLRVYLDLGNGQEWTFIRSGVPSEVQVSSAAPAARPDSPNQARAAKIHDGQVRVDGLALVVVDRAGLQVVLGHPERFLDLEELVVGADDELGGDRGAVRAGRQVGGVALEPGQGPALASRPRLTVFSPAARVMNRFSPATAFSALATCSSIPRRVRRPRSARNWQ